MPDDKRPALYNEHIGFFRNLVLQARLVWLLLRDPRVPLWLKAMPIASLAYLISPLDFLPDSIPILTQLDDVAILLLGFRLFIDLSPPEVVAEHLQKLNEQASSWKVESGATKDSKADLESGETGVIDGSYTEPPPEE